VENFVFLVSNGGFPNIRTKKIGGREKGVKNKKLSTPSTFPSRPTTNIQKSLKMGENPSPKYLSATVDTQNLTKQNFENVSLYRGTAFILISQHLQKIRDTGIKFVWLNTE
jgi:hypothetical protein